MKNNYLFTAKAVFIASLAFSATAVLAERPSGTPTCTFTGGAFYSSNNTLYLESFADESAEVLITDTDAQCINSNRTDGARVIVERDTPLKSTSTLMLPFDANMDSPCLKAYDIKQFGKNNGKWEITAADSAGHVQRNRPVIVRVKTETEGCQDLTEISLTFRDVSKTENNDDALRLYLYNPNSAQESNFFIDGTLKYKKWNTGDAGIEKVYGYAAKNKDGASGGQFVKIGGGAFLPPLRAYLEYQGSGLAKKSSDKVEDFELPETINVRLIDGDSTLSVGKLNTVTGEIQMDSRRFDLNGRAINGKSANHGVYVGKQKIVR